MEQADTGLASGEVVFRLIGDAYEAALDSRQWPTLLRDLSAVLRTPALRMTVRQASAGDPGEVYRLGMTPRGEAALRASEPPLGPDRGPASLPDEIVVHGGAASGVRSPVGAPGGSQPGTDFFSFRCDLVRRSGRPTARLSGLRRGAHGEYGREELDLLRSLAPHLKRAVLLRRRISEAALRRDASDAVVDRLDMGVALLDGEGRMLSMNARAREIFRRGDGLAVDQTGLRAGRAGSAALRLAIAEAAKASRSAILAVPRVSGKQPYGVMVAPLRARALQRGERRVPVGVFLDDPEDRPKADVEVLQELHALTPTEARIAATLAAGLSPPETADALRMRLSTLRFHLKRVFAKTGTRRQADLVRLVLTGLAPLRRTPPASDGPRREP